MNDLIKLNRVKNLFKKSSLSTNNDNNGHDNGNQMTNIDHNDNDDDDDDRLMIGSSIGRIFPHTHTQQTIL